MIGRRITCDKNQDFHHETHEIHERRKEGSTAKFAIRSTGSFFLSFFVYFVCFVVKILIFHKQLCSDPFHYAPFEQSERHGAAGEDQVVEGT
jgi:hypothetical protein